MPLVGTDTCSLYWAFTTRWWRPEDSTVCPVIQQTCYSLPGGVGLYTV